MCNNKDSNHVSFESMDILDIIIDNCNRGNPIRRMHKELIDKRDDFKMSYTSLYRLTKKHCSRRSIKQTLENNWHWIQDRVSKKIKICAIYEELCRVEGEICSSSSLYKFIKSKVSDVEGMINTNDSEGKMNYVPGVNISRKEFLERHWDWINEQISNKMNKMNKKSVYYALCEKEGEFCSLSTYRAFIQGKLKAIKTRETNVVSAGKEKQHLADYVNW